MAVFLPTANVTPVNFVAYGGTVSTFATAVAQAFPGAPIQVSADATTGHTTNALVVVGQSQAFSVVSGDFFGQGVHGQWEVWGPDNMAGGGGTAYTPYTPPS